MDLAQSTPQNRQRQRLVIPQTEQPQEGCGSWLLLLDLPELALLPSHPLSQGDLSPLGSRSYPMHIGPRSMDPLGTRLAPVPLNRLNSQGSSPAIELKETETGTNGDPALDPSMGTVWDAACIDPSGLAWDEPMQNPLTTIAEVLEKADPTLPPSQLELPSAHSTSQSETTSRSSSSPNKRIRIGVPSRESSTLESPPCGPNNGSDGDSLKARSRHNKVEKNYRSRLNSRFLGLLKVLRKDQKNDKPRVGGKFEALSRGAVLDIASERIESLEAENHLLKLKLKTYDDLRNMYQIYNVQPHTEKHQS